MKRYAFTLQSLAAATLGCTLVLAAAPAFSHGKHEHGVVRLDVALDGKDLVLQLESPLDSVLGFEHLPRSAGERKAVADMLGKLRQGAKLFQPVAVAGCAFQEAQLDSALLEAAPATSSASSAAPGKAPVAQPKQSEQPESEHLDMDATYHFSCTSPQQLSQITQSLFTTFPRVQRIEIQTASGKGQGKQTLRRPDSTIRLME